MTTRLPGASRRAVAGSPGLQPNDGVDDTFRGWPRTITRNVLVTWLSRRARQPVGAGGTQALLKMQEVAGPHVELPEEDPFAHLHGLYQRALELVRGGFEARLANVLAERRRGPPCGRGGRVGVSAAAVRKARSRVLRRLMREVGDAVD